MKIYVGGVDQSYDEMIAHYLKQGLTSVQVADAIERSVICSPLAGGNFGFSVAWGSVKFKLDELISGSADGGARR